MPSQNLLQTAPVPASDRTSAGKGKMVSIIVPVYNVSRFLPDCLESLFAQTYPWWEAVCVNDGSTDDSLVILREYASRDQRIKIIDSTNQGLSCARNLGMEHVTGEYVMYLDSDDFIHPQTLEIAYTLAERDSSDVVSWYMNRFRPGDMWPPKEWNHRWNINSIRCKVTDDVVSSMSELRRPSVTMQIRHFYVWRHLLRTELARNVKFIPHLRYEDFPWWSEIMLSKPRTTITNLKLYYYRCNPVSITGELRGRTFERMKCWIKGLESTFSLYRDNADSHQMKCWSKNCKWPVINYFVAQEFKKMSMEDAGAAAVKLGEMEKAGVFEDGTGLRNRFVRWRVSRFIHSPFLRWVQVKPCGIPKRFKRQCGKWLKSLAGRRH